MSQIVIAVRDPVAATTRAFDQDEILVGRAEESDIVLADRAASRRHARLVRVDMRDQPLQGIFSAERGKVRDLRLEATDKVGGGIDDVAAKAEYRIIVLKEHPRKPRRLRVEADTDQRVVVLPGMPQ